MIRDDLNPPVMDGEREENGVDLDVVYRVDGKGRLTFVNDGWNVFAEQNGTPELIGSAVLGHPVSDYIAGLETKLIYDRISRRAEAGVHMQLPYRCDSPSQRRHMLLSIAAHGPDEIEFRSHVVGVQSRDSVAVLEPGLRQSSGLLSICSWCNRGQLGDRWLEIEAVVSELQLFDAEVPRLTHGMCPECVVLVTAGLAP